jgi:hypothetical protein
MFNAISWAKEKLWDAPSLEDGTVDCVAGFTILWNVFEGCLCDNHANIRTFNNITVCLTSTSELRQAIDESISYYNSRYVDGDKMKSLFDDLNFRKNDRKNFVANVLRGNGSELSDKVLALLIIVYRIRCNIFHGEKPATTWHSQTENISKASRILSIIIKAKNLSS